MKMKVSDFKLYGITSDFINSLDLSEDEEITLQIPERLLNYLNTEKITLEQLLNDFNSRIITPSNIQPMYFLLNFLNIKDTNKIILSWTVPTEQNYKLENDYGDSFKLPNFIIMSNKNICKKAACLGLLRWLKFAHERGDFWNESVCRYAAYYGHLNCLKYAIEHGCPVNGKVCSEAARRGHLECLKYAHENRCTWNARTCSNSARNGHLDCLKYAFENGCPIDHKAVDYAAKNNHLHCLKYLHKIRLWIDLIFVTQNLVL